MMMSNFLASDWKATSFSIKDPPNLGEIGDWIATQFTWDGWDYKEC